MAAAAARANVAMLGRIQHQTTLRPFDCPFIRQNNDCLRFLEDVRYYRQRHREHPEDMVLESILDCMSRDEQNQYDQFIVGENAITHTSAEPRKPLMGM